MKLTIVTGWSPSGWIEYGRRFVETFVRHWPDDVDLVVYGEEPVPLPRGEFRRLDAIPGCAEFLERHAGNAAARGRDVRADWKPRDRAAGYNWRFDAWKFCRQGFIPWHAAQQLSGVQLLCWLDGDVVTHRDVPRGFVESLMPADADVAYLGRHPKHSEIGFQLYRWPHALPALKAFSDLYASDRIFGLREWHSAFAFDHAVRESNVRAHDLTPGGRGHVWQESPLAAYTDHLKGDRKRMDRSPEARR